MLHLHACQEGRGAAAELPTGQAGIAAGHAATWPDAGDHRIWSHRYFTSSVACAVQLSEISWIDFVYQCTTHLSALMGPM